MQSDYAGSVHHSDLGGASERFWYRLRGNELLYIFRKPTLAEIFHSRPGNITNSHPGQSVRVWSMIDKGSNSTFYSRIRHLEYQRGMDKKRIIDADFCCLDSILSFS